MGKGTAGLPAVENLIEPVLRAQSLGWGRSSKLFVAGSSVFPSVGISDPTVATDTLALRLSDAPVADLRGPV